MTIQVLPQVTIIFLLIFARIGTIIMLMPGFSNNAINTRARLSLALLISLVFFPLVEGNYANVTEDFLQVAVLLARELLIGLVIGLITSLVISTTQIAGTTIATQVGLAYSQTFDPTQGTQGVVLGSFMSTIAVVLIFVTDLHHVAIGAMFDSYQLFRPGDFPVSGDVLMLALRVLASSFVVAMQMSAPFLAFGLIFYLGIGVLSRLMPQVQIFFVAMPANIAVGLIMFGLLLSTMMFWYLAYVRDTLALFIAG